MFDTTIIKKIIISKYRDNLNSAIKINKIKKPIFKIYFIIPNLYHTSRESRVLAQKKNIYDIQVEIAAPLAPILGIKI
jgi:hypothetical protein